MKNLGFALAAGLLLFSCGADSEETPQNPHEGLRGPFSQWPSAPPAPVASTPELVALGNRLYHETALSKTGDVSCASCHNLDTFGQDNLKVSPGTQGLLGKRSAPSTFNAFRQIAQFWDGRADSVETQSTMPMLTDVEHGLVSEDEIVGILAAEESYRADFARAFPDAAGDPLTADHVRAAIGAFERTLITVSPFDRWLDGDDKALSPAQLAGLQEFVQVGCTACHGTRAVGGSMFHKLGLVEEVGGDDSRPLCGYWARVRPLSLQSALPTQRGRDGSLPARWPFRYPRGDGFLYGPGAVGPRTQRRPSGLHHPLPAVPDGTTDRPRGHRLSATLPMKHLLSSILACSLPFASCGSPDPIPEAQAKAMSQELTKALIGELQRTMASDGPAAAITVCADLAPIKAKEIATDELSIRRIGTRARNAEKNTPTPAERKILDSLTPEAPTYTGVVDGEPKFFQGIFIPNATCLVCHGEKETIAAPVLDALAKRYPDDKAFGYSVGDLRGALVVERR